MSNIEFANYKEWLKGYQGFSDYFKNELSRIRNNEPKKIETKEEIYNNLQEIALKLTIGAAKLQIITDNTFYINNDKIEIMIRWKQDYDEISEVEILKQLIEEVKNTLKSDKKQLERISRSLLNNSL